MGRRWIAALALIGCASTTAPPGQTGGDTAGPGDSGQHVDTAAGELSDPLSMPLEPTLSLDDFSGSAVCASCHPDHASQWALSTHSIAMVDPVFRALVAVRQADLHGQEDAFCLQCHSAIGVRSRDVTPGFSFDDLAPITLEGVGCEACHTISTVERTWNAGHTLDPGGPMRGGLTNPAQNSFHDSQPSTLFKSARLCGSCHDVIETNGLPIERAYGEWEGSPADDDGRACQTCHMDTWSGAAANGGPDREELHDHRFVGVDLPLDPDALSQADRADLRARVTALLQSSATITVHAASDPAPGAQLDLIVTIQNDIDAHNLPTGSTFNRQLWVALTVRDATGAVLFETGDLDAQGDLRDHWSALDPYGDADLISLQSGFIDAAGQRTLFTHEAVEHRRSSLEPLHARAYTLFVPVPADAVAPLTVDASLRFRPYGPFLLRALNLDSLIPQLEITDIDAVQVALSWP